MGPMRDIKISKLMVDPVSVVSVCLNDSSYYPQLPDAVRNLLRACNSSLALLSSGNLSSTYAESDGRKIVGITAMRDACAEFLAGNSQWVNEYDVSRLGQQLNQGWAYAYGS